VTGCAWRCAVRVLVGEQNIGRANLPAVRPSLRACIHHASRCNSACGPSLWQAPDEQTAVFCLTPCCSRRSASLCTTTCITAGFSATTMLGWTLSSAALSQSGRLERHPCNLDLNPHCCNRRLLQALQLPVHGRSLRGRHCARHHPHPVRPAAKRREAGRCNWSQEGTPLVGCTHVLARV
jgi:hypothetical protein